MAAFHERPERSRCIRGFFSAAGKAACPAAFAALMICAGSAFVPAPAQAQLRSLPHADLDSAEAAARADSVRAHADSARADSLGGRADTVNYSARRIRYRNDRFSLSDNALLTYRGASLTADSIVYYNDDNLVEAMGAPLITDPLNPPILGYRMRYNLKTRVGEIYYGSSKKGNQTFNGVEVRRQKDGDVYIARGDFSTCDLPQDKHYYFYSRRMILEPKSKVLSGPIVMNVAEVPVAILPMMVMPLGTGRRSGLLQPKLGGDQAQGFYVRNLGYYWAINDFTDLKMAGDIVEGAAGTFDRTNLNGEFRYNRRYAYSGYLSGTAYVSEFDLTNPGWSLAYAHDQTITPDGRQTLKGSGQFVSEPEVIRRNALDATQAANQTANATLGYSRQFDWNNANFNANFAQNYNLTTGLLDRSLPDLGFRVGAPLFPADEDEPDLPGKEPWYRQLTYDYSNRFNVNMVRIPDAAAAGGNGDTNTYAGYQDGLTLSGKYPLLQYFNVTPSVNVGQMWTATQRGTPDDPVRNDWDPAAGERGEYFATFRTGAAVDTRIYGIAQPEGGPWFGRLAGIRHTISPSVSYTYAPKIDSNPRFLPNPKLGGTAFQARQQTVGLTLGNDVDLKFDPGEGSRPAGQTSAPAKKPKAEAYKLLSARSGVSYNFARNEREWSDIQSTFDIYFVKNVPFSLSTTHALYDDYSAGSRNALVSPVLTEYGFGWRKGIALTGKFNDGLRIADAPGGFARFESAPWSLNLNYNFQYRSTRVGSGGSEGVLAGLFGGNGTFRRERTHSATGNLKLNPTAGWEMSYDTDYDFSRGRFSRHSFSFHRVLHCWDMDFRWTPQGLSEGWQFVIRITDLPDVKLETSDSRTRGARR